MEYYLITKIREIMKTGLIITPAGEVVVTSHDPDPIDTLNLGTNLAKVIVDDSIYKYSDIQIGAASLNVPMHISSQLTDVGSESLIITTAKHGPLLTPYSRQFLVPALDRWDSRRMLMLMKIEQLKAICDFSNYRDVSLFGAYLPDFCECTRSQFTMRHYEPVADCDSKKRINEILNALSRDKYSTECRWVEHPELLSTFERGELSKHGYTCETVMNTRTHRLMTVVRN